ncbi:MAG TPA: transposase [Candidatus Kapabacteria bacterium]|nr:transposase [Candidatus Kapabacteria bacterium]
MQAQSESGAPTRDANTFERALHLAIRNYAEHLVQTAIDIETTQFVDTHSARTGPEGRRHVVRNGYMPIRVLRTGIGPLTIKQPRVKDRSDQVTFTSSLLRRYARAIAFNNIESLLPYIGGTGRRNFTALLRSIFGKHVDELPRNLARRIETGWRRRHRHWVERDLSTRKFSRLWAGSANVAGDSGDKQSLLLLIGKAENGAHEIIAMAEGTDTGKRAWLNLIRQVSDRGLAIDPATVSGNPRSGVWAALARHYPSN